ncbi:MAG: hypothetical protein WKF37_03245 [Bryobacteraceae bacterium]
MDQLGSVLQQYGGGTQQSQNAESDYDQVVNVAPREAVSGGLAEAFRSDQTPPFPNMLGQLFGNSNGSQRASILNTLLATVGPSLLSGALGRFGQGGQQHVTPEIAQQVSPQEIEELSAKAAQQDPTVIDRVSDFYAEHPTLVKSLGAAALGVALSGLSKQKRGMF